MQKPVRNLESIVRERMSKLEGNAHSYEHVKRVFQIATFLAKKEKADLELVQVGALLHDIGWTLGQPHNETGAKLAGEILKGINYPQERIERIINIVLRHPLDLRDKLETLEERIVWDADKVDLLGAVGIARGFHFYGNKPFEVAVKASFEVLTPIYNMLNTSTAKKIARKRNNLTMSFLSALKEELQKPI
jgi:uncharacterized protein